LNVSSSKSAAQDFFLAAEHIHRTGKWHTFKIPGC